MLEGERWLLPAGVEETLPERAARLERGGRTLIDLFASWGYQLVIPPFIEYLESLLTGTGTDLDLQTFKLIDQLTGRSMGVRADMTPQVARIDAHHLKREAPVRLCYIGTVLLTRPSGLSGSRSPVQVGAELYGHAGVESDCEVLCLMLETLAAVRVEKIHLDIGHVGVFRALAAQAGLRAEHEAQLFDVLQRKSRAEVDALLNEFGVAGHNAAMIAALVDLNGGDEVLAEAERTLRGADPAVSEALASLAALADSMRRRVPDVPLHFDLAELRGYRYHTGVVFAAFVPGHGQSIARGGRYDEVGRVFGRARPATGFSTDLKVLVELSEGFADAAPPSGVLAPWSDDPGLLAKVRELRTRGESVVYELPGQPGGASDVNCDRRLQKEGDAWVVVAVGGE